MVKQPIDSVANNQTLDYDITEEEMFEMYEAWQQYEIDATNDVQYL